MRTTKLYGIAAMAAAIALCTFAANAETSLSREAPLPRQAKRATAGSIHATRKAARKPEVGAKAPAAKHPMGSFKRRVPIPPWMTAAMRAEDLSEHKIAGYLKARDLDSALAECNFAMAASAAAWGDVASPRLRHLYGAIYLAAGKYDRAYRIFEDIGHHNGEMYEFDDFDMDVALAAVHVGNPGHAEFLVGRFLGRFDPTGFEGRVNLLPGFGSPAAAIATVHAARGVNFSCTAQWEEARVELNLAAQIAPYNAYIALQRAIALHFSGHDGQARACLEVAKLSGDPAVKRAAEGEVNTLDAEAKTKAEAAKTPASGK